MAKLIRFLVLVLLLPLIYAFVREAFAVFATDVSLEAIKWFLFGLAAYLLFYALFLRGRIAFWEVFDHELTHLFVSVLFFQKPKQFVVAPGQADGWVAWEGGCGYTFIVLAPYFLPLLVLPLLPVRCFVSAPPFSVVLDILLGVALGFHLGALVSSELRLRQSDLRNVGIIVSLVWIFLFSIVLLVIVLYVVSGDCAAILDYFKNGWTRTVDAYKITLEWLRTSVIPALRGFFGG